MSLIKFGIDLMERGLLPDAVVRAAIRRLLARRLADMPADCERRQDAFQQHCDMLRSGPIADVPDIANAQHYEVPAEFFQLTLGQRLKYSSAFWPAGTDSLDAAEEQALRVTCEHAGLRDGQDVLELGCGWGSLSLWMAEHYPQSRITAVSNSRTQREFILDRAEQQGLHNLTVLTADMNDFAAPAQFDRIVSVEMFEHMRNYEQLFGRIAGWLKPDGRLFVHVFCHRDTPYLFQTDGEADWMGRYFFTGGQMPSDHLFAHFQRDLRLTRQWSWDGRHYERTSNAWLANMDRHRGQIMEVFRQTYGPRDAQRWYHRWRVFFMACAELFGYRGGREWWVSHYLFAPQSVPAGKSLHRHLIADDRTPQ